MNIYIVFVFSRLYCLVKRGVVLSEVNWRLPMTKILMIKHIQIFLMFDDNDDTDRHRSDRILLHSVAGNSWHPCVVLLSRGLSVCYVGGELEGSSESSKL